MEADGLALESLAQKGAVGTGPERPCVTRWPQRGCCSLDETLGAPRFPAQQAGAGFLVTGRRRPGRGRVRGVSVLPPRPRQPTATIVNDVATCGSACRLLTTRPRRPGPGPLPGRRTPPGGRGSRRCPCLAGGGSCCRPGSHGGVRVARAGPSTPGRTGAREHARCQHRARRGGKPGQGWPRPPPCLADSPCTEGQAAGLGRPLRLTGAESRLFPTRPPEHRGGGATAPRGLGGAVSSHARDPWRTTPTQAAVPQTSSRTGPARVSRAPRGLGGKAVPACGTLRMQPPGPHRGLRRASVTCASAARCLRLGRAACPYHAPHVLGTPKTARARAPVPSSSDVLPFGDSLAGDTFDFPLGYG